MDTNTMWFILLAALLVCLCVFAYRRRSSLNASTPRDLNPPKRANPFKGAERNATRADLENFVARLLRTAPRAGYQVVVPAVVEAGGECSVTTVALVGAHGVIGLNCAGYGGTVYVENAGSAGKWSQKLNGTVRPISNQDQLSAHSAELLRTVLAERGCPGVPVQCCTVFVNPKVEISGAGAANRYLPDAFVEELRAGTLAGGSVGLDQAAVAAALSSAAKELQEKQKAELAAKAAREKAKK